MDYSNCKLCPKSLCNGGQSGIDEEHYYNTHDRVHYRIMFPCFSDPSLKKIIFTAAYVDNSSRQSINSNNFNDCIDFIVNNANLELEDTLELIKYKNEMTENVCPS